MHSRMRSVAIRLVIGGVVTLGWVVLSCAEDPSAIVASLNDPAAECRYLRQKWLESKRSIRDFQAITKDYVDTVNQMTQLPYSQSGAYRQRAKELESKVNAHKTFSFRSFSEYNDAKGVVQAKRGTKEPCPGVEKDDYQEPEPSSEAKPKASLEDRLKELKNAREKNLISPEEYYDKRAELLKGF